VWGARGVSEAACRAAAFRGDPLVLCRQGVAAAAAEEVPHRRRRVEAGALREAGVRVDRRVVLAGPLPLAAAAAEVRVEVLAAEAEVHGEALAAVAVAAVAGVDLADVVAAAEEDDNTTTTTMMKIWIETNKNLFIH